MPNKLFKVLSIIVAMLPSCFVWLLLSKIDVYYKLTSFVIISLIIFGLFYYLINIAKNFGYSLINPTKVTPVNHEMLLFLTLYMLPILTVLSVENIGSFILIALSILFLADSYYCSPLFAVFGYRMYQIELNGVVFLLITKINIQNLEDAKINVVKLTSNICLDNS